MKILLLNFLNQGRGGPGGTALLTTLAEHTEPVIFSWVVHACNPSTGKLRPADLCESEGSLIYKARSRTARAAKQKNLVLKNHSALEHVSIQI